ncbi:hypothetical protein KM043_010255 [Ampulex compressa]|nr:hypothetical protein KM043_010255 [Ampulex compressa]
MEAYFEDIWTQSTMATISEFFPGPLVFPRVHRNQGKKKHPSPISPRINQSHLRYASNPESNLMMIRDTSRSGSSYKGKIARQDQAASSTLKDINERKSGRKVTKDPLIREKRLYNGNTACLSFSNEIAKGKAEARYDNTSDVNWNVGTAQKRNSAVIST